MGGRGSWALPWKANAGSLTKAHPAESLNAVADTDAAQTRGGDPGTLKYLPTDSTSGREDGGDGGEGPSRGGFHGDCHRLGRLAPGPRSAPLCCRGARRLGRESW